MDCECLAEEEGTRHNQKTFNAVEVIKNLRSKKGIWMERHFF